MIQHNINLLQTLAGYENTETSRIILEYEKDWGLIHIKMIKHQSNRASGLKNIELAESLKQVLYENSEQYFRA